MVQEKLSDIIKLAISDIDGAKGFEGELYLDLPSDARFGDLSTNVAMRLCKFLKKSPREVASALSEAIRRRLKEDQLNRYVSDIKVEGAGFINFYLTDAYFYSQLKMILDKGNDFARSDIGRGKRVLVEFVSANPTGPLSVAHARQAAVGDALASILKYLGFEASREYYLNDEGNQINILGRSIELRLKELSGEKIEFPEDHYQGDYIVDIAREIKEKGLKVDDFSEYGEQYILDIIKKELSDFGVKFDCWYSQKSLRKSGKIDAGLNKLKEKGFIYEDGGAVWFRSTSFGDDKDRVVIKSDGSYTYLAPDIAYHQEKYLRGFEWLINLWGPDHHGYIKRLTASVEAFGKRADSLSVVIVQLASIFRNGKPVQMSTRSGEFVTLREIVNEVGKDVARYFFMMRKCDAQLVFDLDLAKKKSDENPVYYIQYAHARICSIIRNAAGAGAVPVLEGTNLELLTTGDDLDLIKVLAGYPDVVVSAASDLEPHRIAFYLLDLATAFHRFYNRNRVITEDAALTSARLVLIDAVRQVIANALALMGIDAPESM